MALTSLRWIETLSWAREVKNRGIDLPLHVGVPGAVHRQKLLRASKGRGIGESGQVPHTQRGLLRRFFTRVVTVRTRS